MEIQITARHCEIPETLRRRAERHARRLGRYESRLMRADIIFDTEDRVKQVETRVFVGGDRAIVSNGTAWDFQTALDQALERAARQLKRQRSRHRNHQAVKLADLPLPAVES